MHAKKYLNSKNTLNYEIIRKNYQRCISNDHSVQYLSTLFPVLGRLVLKLSTDK